MTGSRAARVALALACAACGRSRAEATAADAAVAAPDAGDGLPSSWEHIPDIEYVPTPQVVVDKMLEVLELHDGDVLYDLGCGDGRIVVTAAQRYGVKAFGWDIDPRRVREARANVKKAGVEGLATIEIGDVFKLDLSPATAVTLYLLPQLNVRLIPQLQRLRRGSRIVSHDFDMEGLVPPDRKWILMAPHFHFPHKEREHFVFFWTAPLAVRDL